MPTRGNGSNFSPTDAPCEFFVCQFLRKDFFANAAMFFISKWPMKSWRRLRNCSRAKTGKRFRDGRGDQWEGIKFSNRSNFPTRYQIVTRRIKPVVRNNNKELVR